MKQLYRQFLFAKGILVSERPAEHPAETIVALAAKFGVHVTDGAAYADAGLLSFVADELGYYIPDAFYKGFPETVRALSPTALLLDQLIHYFQTYGCDDFRKAGHALFEADITRTACREHGEEKCVVILPEREAEVVLAESIANLFAGSRPLAPLSYEVVRTYFADGNPLPEVCTCKDTAIRLLLDTRNLAFADFLMLSDVIKLVERMQYQLYKSDDCKKLNFKNRDRVFVTNVIYALFAAGKCNVDACFERKKLWCGLLHHIHFVPKTPDMQTFAAQMRGCENHSAYAEFERHMRARNIAAAVRELAARKGDAAVLRQLNYIVSRTESDAEIDMVLATIKMQNPIVLLQLLLSYGSYNADAQRTFVFTSHNRATVHRETEAEQASRRSRLSAAQVARLSKAIEAALADCLRGRLGKVYIHPDMARITVPLGESTKNSGYGVLPRGSRLALPDGKVLRFFTYWEKVNDIDLSLIGMDESGVQTEFSWRTMYEKQSEEIAFSGDQTSGYNGGSEYFDVDLTRFMQKYPAIRYLVLCNNVYSSSTFDACTCRAGYMLRAEPNSGEIFEPKTVKSAFTVAGDSTFAYLFGVDLTTREFVWLNTMAEYRSHVAGTTSLAFLLPTFTVTHTMHLARLFSMLATEVVADRDDADVWLSDTDTTDRADVTVIRSCDFDKILAILK